MYARWQQRLDDEWDALLRDLENGVITREQYQAETRILQQEEKELAYQEELDELNSRYKF